MLSIFETASSISKGVALAAFVVACILYAYKIRSDNDLKKVERADSDFKVQVVRRLADKYGIPTEKISGREATRLQLNAFIRKSEYSNGLQSWFLCCRLPHLLWPF